MNTSLLTIALLLFVFCFILERALPGQALPRAPGWWSRVILINAVQFAVIWLAGKTWETWFTDRSLFHLSAWGTVGGGLAAYVISTFVFYWWHRWRHESDLLWRLFHQVHHSPTRIEVATSFYKHPLEMMANSLLGSVLVYGLLGLSPAGGAVYTFCTALGEFFYHTNVRTPRWIGYLFQRPEMHRVHHEFGKHKNNYGDIALWDILFGTFENPAVFAGRCGFEPEQELLLGEMLAFEDACPPEPNDTAYHPALN